MIRRKVRSTKNEKIYPPDRAAQAKCLICCKKELYNVIPYTIKGSFKLNYAGYA